MSRGVDTHAPSRPPGMHVIRLAGGEAAQPSVAHAPSPWHRGVVPQWAAMGDSYAVAVRTASRMPIPNRYRTDQCKASAGFEGYFLFQS
jgi:hypothetical protein